MISLREMRYELTGVRFGATSHSLWSIQVTVNERARIAINDALRVYAFYAKDVYNSLVISTNLTAVPKNVDHVLGVSVTDNTANVTSEKRFKFVPTPNTLLLETYITDLPQTAVLSYESRVNEMPEDVFVVGTISNTVAAVTVSGENPAAVWPSPGYLEFTYDNTSGKEIARYDMALPTGFTNMVRGISGHAAAWPSGTRVSPVALVDPEALATIMSAAEASMYGYWLGHRSQYDTYLASANLGQMEVADLVAMIQMSEARADRRYRRSRKSLAPTKGRRG